MFINTRRLADAVATAKRFKCLLVTLEKEEKNRIEKNHRIVLIEKLVLLAEERKEVREELIEWKEDIERLAMKKMIKIFQEDSKSLIFNHIPTS